MKPSLAALLAASALLVAGCSSHKTDEASTTSPTTVNASETAAPAENATAPAPSAGQSFANGAAASDAFEIASSKLAADNGASPAVTKFAGQMIEAHTQSTAKLTSLAGGLSPAITPDATLDADQQAKLDDLKSKKGDAFDKGYVADQVAAHEKALAMLQSYSASGDVPAFKQFATELAPKVAAHLNMAKALDH